MSARFRRPVSPSRGPWFSTESGTATCASATLAVSVADPRQGNLDPTLDGDLIVFCSGRTRHAFPYDERRAIPWRDGDASAHRLQRLVDTLLSCTLLGRTGEPLTYLADTDHAYAGQPPATVQGRSFDLSVALVIAADRLEREIPVDVVCSAEVTDDGELLAADGLAHKVRTLVRRAPAVRVLVTGPLSRVARAALAALVAEQGGGLSVHEAATLDAAITWILGRPAPDSSPSHEQPASVAPLPPLLASTLTGIAQDNPLVDSAADHARHVLALRTLSKTDQAPTTWHVVAQTLRALSTHAPAHDWMATLAAAVAARYAGESHADVSLPASNDLEALPLDLARETVAHLIQHQLEFACFAPADFDALLQTWLPSDRQRLTVEDLKILGSYVRYQQASGALTAAWRDAEQILLQWLRRDRPGDISHPLCMGFRLASMAPPEQADRWFDSCERLWHALRPRIPTADHTWVLYERARSLLQVHPTPAAARDQILALEATRDLRPAMRLHLVRWRVRAGLALPDSLPTSGVGGRTRALLALDAALANEDLVAAAEAATVLEAARRGPVLLVRRAFAAAPSGEQLAAIARFHPL